MSQPAIPATRQRRSLIPPGLKTGLLFLLLLYLVVLWQGPGWVNRYHLWRLGEETLVAHAMGASAGKTYTNSLEAFQENYGRGFRLFEVDLQLDQDGALVAQHDPLQERQGREGGTPPRFSLNDILNLLGSHPDVRIVTDFKTAFGPTMEAFREEVLSHGSRLWPNFLVQIYDPEDLDQALEHPPVDLILTLYRSRLDDAQVLDLVGAQPRIKFVTMSRERFSPRLVRQLHQLDRKVFVHTLNDEEEILAFLKAGADGIYTDSYWP